MNILLINTNHHKGGAARVAGDLKRGLESRGHTVRFFAASGVDHAQGLYALPRPSVFTRARMRLGLGGRYPSDALLDMPEFKTADIVHCHNLHGGYFDLRTLAKIAARKPLVWTLHDMWALTDGCAYSSAEAPDARGIYPCAARGEAADMRVAHKTPAILVAPSLWLIQKISLSYLSPKRTEHIPNGVDTALFAAGDKAAARITLGLPADKKIVLFVATNDPRKGWHHLEEVRRQFADVSDVFFVPVGGTHYLADRERLATYYRAADALLFASLQENLPLVVLEAMSAGLPIASFAVGGVPEVLVDTQGGFLAPVGDSSGLADALRHALALGAPERAAMSVYNQTAAKNCYSLETMAQAHETLYQTLI